MGCLKTSLPSKGIGKMLQNGQTEPVGVTRRRMCIRREVKFVHSKRHKFKEQPQIFEVVLPFVIKLQICRCYTLIYFCLFAIWSILTFPIYIS